MGAKCLSSAIFKGCLSFLYKIWIVVFAAIWRFHPHVFSSCFHPHWIRTGNFGSSHAISVASPEFVSPDWRRSSRHSAPILETWKARSVWGESKWGINYHLRFRLPLRPRWRTYLLVWLVDPGPLYQNESLMDFNVGILNSKGTSVEGSVFDSISNPR